MAQLRHDYSEFVQRDFEAVVVGPEGAAAFASYCEKESLPLVGLPDAGHSVLKLYGQQVDLFKLGSDARAGAHRQGRGRAIRLPGIHGYALQAPELSALVDVRAPLGDRAPSFWADSLLPVRGPWLRASEPGSVAELILPAASDHSDDGEHLIEYRSVDLAGNVEPAKQVKVLIDTREPQVTLRPTAAAQPGEVLITATAGKKAVVKFTVQDQLSPEIRYVGYVLDRKGVRAVRSAASEWLPLEGVHSWRFTCRLKPGLYRVEIRAEDRAGNVGVSEAAFVVKKAVPAAK